ncbi:MAG: hypothetical protein KDK39_18855, partial [Leptospiraceae bacterium]|nr:hypothetical protein [Leptospiraceae bacterium]
MKIIQHPGRTLILLTLGLIAFGSSTAREKEPAGSSILTGLDFQPLELSFAPIQKENTAYGRLYSLDDQALPIMDLSIILPGKGLANESIDQAGRLKLTLQLLKEGGAGGRSGTDIAHDLASRGS